MGAPADGLGSCREGYVAAQDPDDPGVLILSGLAGAAEQMREVIIVNLLSREDMAEAMRRALTMSQAERVERWSALHAGVTREDVSAWRDHFVKALTAPVTPDLRVA